MGWRIARHVAAWWPDAPHFETHSATLPVSSELLELTHAGANKEKWGSLAALATAAISTLTGDPLAANRRPLLAFWAFMPNDCPYLIVEAPKPRICGGGAAFAARHSLRAIRATHRLDMFVGAGSKCASICRLIYSQGAARYGLLQVDGGSTKCEF